MNIFVIRHGISNELREQRWQSPNSFLNGEGLSQARLLAKRLKSFPIDVILSSKWPRARETAEVVAKALKKPFELFDGIHERELNPRLYGVKWSSRIHKLFYKEGSKNFSNLDWKFEGKGESIRDVITRAVKFEKHLTKDHLGENILVISHDVFIRCFVSICILGKKYKDETFFRVFNSLTFSSAGISLLEYNEKVRIWKIKYLNDHSHLES